MPPTTSTQNTTEPQVNEDAKNRIAQGRALRDSGVSSVDTRRAVRTGQPPATITAASLAPRPEATLATPVTPTLAPALAGEIQAETDNFTANLEAKANALEPAATSGLQSYIDSLTQARGVTGLTNEAYRADGGVDTIQVELNDINDQIRKEQRALDLATRNITEKGGGLKTGAQAEINNLQRVSLQKQADLSIIQQGVQGRFDSAKAIADRAVAAQLEQQTNDLAIAKFNYEENKELFTKAEQRAFESKVADRERLLTEQKENKTAIYDLGIQAQIDGAPTDVVKAMLAAETKEEAAAIGGSYIGALDREAKRASIRSSNASAALNELDLKLTQEAATRAEEDAASGVLPLEGVAIAQTINKDFEDEPIVKQYNDALAKAIVLEDTLENGIDGIQDLQLVYEFMKAVDPASVVRETEFATAAETGNIFQGSYSKFNKAFGTGGFLPEQVKEDFIRAARSSFDAKNTQYFNVKNEKAKQINQRLGINNGADYLTAYESATPLQPVDFDIADSLTGATEQDMLDIMQMQQDLLASPSGQ